ncbi:MAG: hypothetical protein FWG84_03225 [Bacteroidales bacterium]|nr:hypothetical protein [Bacteroidales bacterium]
MKSLLFKTFLFSIAMVAVTAILKYAAILPAIHDQWHFMLVFYFVLTTFILYQLLKVIRKTMRKFIAIFLSMTALRMILFTAAILLYAFLIQHDDSRNIVGFTLTFSVYYLVFTTWEIILIVSFLRSPPTG